MGTAEPLPTSSCLILPFFLPFHSPLSPSLSCVLGMGLRTPGVAVHLSLLDSLISAWDGYKAQDLSAVLPLPSLAQDIDPQIQLGSS